MPNGPAYESSPEAPLMLTEQELLDTGELIGVDLDDYRRLVKQVVDASS